MIPTLINGWYISTDQRIGPWSVNTSTPTQAQLDNANIIRSFFINEGWTINAICGMLGCMQGESTINPAFIQQTNRYRLPNNASDISDVPNSIMKHFFKEYYQVQNRAFGIGLVQWDGYSNVPVGQTTEEQQKMVAFAIANNIIWYDGWTQLYRLRSEWKYDVDNQTHIFFYPVRYSGVVYTFDNFPTATATPEILAAAWTSGYERNAGGVGYRADNARYYYDYFTDSAAPPVIPPVDFSLPLEANPFEPPFDPANPVDPLQPGLDYIPGWLVSIFARKRKEAKRKWTKV